MYLDLFVHNDKCKKSTRKRLSTGIDRCWDEAKERKKEKKDRVQRERKEKGGGFVSEKSAWV
jgi:hypothetical protein